MSWSASEHGNPLSLSRHHDDEWFVSAVSKVSHMGRVRVVLQEAVGGLGLARKEEPLKVLGWDTGNRGDVLTGLLGCPHAPRIAMVDDEKADAA